jgi:Tfp pilus assembly protein PilO
MAILKTERSKIVFTSAISAIVIAALTWFVFFYQTGLLAEMTDAVQKEKLDSFVKQEKSDKIFKLKKEFDEIDVQKKEMDGMLPAKDNMVPVLRFLEKISSDATCSIKVEAVDISKLKIGPVAKTTKKQAQDEEDDTKTKNSAASQKKTEDQAKQDDLAKVKKFPAFNLTVIGRYSALVDFLTKMENLPFFIRVLTIDVAPAEKEKQQQAAAGTLASGGSAAGGEEGPGSKEVKMSLLVVIYTNE